MALSTFLLSLLSATLYCHALDYCSFLELQSVVASFWKALNILESSFCMQHPDTPLVALHDNTLEFSDV